MHTIDIIEKDIHVEFPSCWEEMSDDQYDYVMQQLVKLEDKKISIDDFKLLVLYKFLNIERSPFDVYKEKRLTPEQLEDKHANIWQLMETLDFFFKIETREEKKCFVFNYESVRNFMPQIRVAGQIFYGPAHGLTDCSFAEYRFAFDCYCEYLINRNPDALNKLTAILWRPERENYQEIKKSVDFDGQRREKFNMNHVEYFGVPKINEAPFYQKYAVFLFFRNCETFLRTGKFNLKNGREMSFSILYEKGEGGTDNGLGLNSLLFTMADAGTFGNIKETDEANLYDVYFKLYDAKIKYDEWKQKNNIKDN